jgi:hypothetical protein
MGMFNMGGTKGVKVASNTFLRAGIHDVTFKGIDKSEKANAIELRFEAEDGAIHNELLFEPRTAERTETQYGPTPSEAEQFTCKVKQIIDAIYPELGKRIDEEGEQFDAPNFDAFIKLLKKHLDPKVGTTVQIKLIPTNNGNFVTFPAFPARVNKDGNLYMTTKFIGEALTLTTKEKSAIDASLNAKPTDMRAKSNELMDLENDFMTDPEEEEDELDKLPF